MRAVLVRKDTEDLARALLASGSGDMIPGACSSVDIFLHAVSHSPPEE